MRVLLVHNYYQQPGGEDQVFASEGQLLEGAGHTVERYTIHNDSIRQMGSLELARKTLWNQRAFAEVQSLATRLRPDVVHVHNTFPLLSPAIHHAARASGAAVVQTLHNYRLYCVNGTFFRDDQECQLCAGHSIPWPAIQHACYRSSRTATLGAVSTVVLHRLLRTWQHKVDRYIALSESAKRTLLRCGLPGDRIEVKPNAVFPDPGFAPTKHGFGLFVGRLVREKGLLTLLSALRSLAGKLPFRIIGGGPLASEASQAAQQIPGVSWLSELPHRTVLDLLGQADVLVIPSEWAEPCPRVAVEALACGTPLIAAKIGALEELVVPGDTGLHFPPRDSEALAETLRWVAEHPTELRAMSKAARESYEARYSGPRHVARLLEIYASAIARRNAV